GQGEGFAFGDLRGKDAIAIMAPPELDGFELLVALAFAGDAQASAVEAALAVIADKTRGRGGHVFLVTQGTVLDKDTSRIVHRPAPHDPTSCGGMTPHEWCRGM